MDQFSFDWARHERVTIQTFKEYRKHDYGHVSTENFLKLSSSIVPVASSRFTAAQTNLPDDGNVLNIVDGSKVSSWECHKQNYGDPKLPLTVGLLINLNNPEGGCNVHCLELFWGTGSRLDREPKRFCIDILPMNSSVFQRVYYKSDDENVINLRGRVKAHFSHQKNELLTPMIGNRFARDIPNITTTRIDFKNTIHIKAIIIKFFDLDDMENEIRPLSIRQLHVWGRLSSDPNGASEVVRNTRIMPSLSDLNFVLDPRLFTSPIIGVVAIEPSNRARSLSRVDVNNLLNSMPEEPIRVANAGISLYYSNGNGKINDTAEISRIPIVKQSRTSAAEKLFHSKLGTFYNLPFHLVQEIFFFFNFQDLQTFGRVSKLLGHYGTFVWTNSILEDDKQYINWGRLKFSKATATSRWNNTEDEDPNNMLDGNSKTWWSSASVQDCYINIDLGHAVPVEHVDILWGDDGGRIRPCSRRFNIEISLDNVKFKVLKRFDGGDTLTQTWRNYHNRAFMPRHDVLDYTTTNVTTDEHCVRYVRIHLIERAPRWANHAITQIDVYGFGRKYENPLLFRNESTLVNISRDDEDDENHVMELSSICNECNTT